MKIKNIFIILFIGLCSISLILSGFSSVPASDIQIKNLNTNILPDLKIFTFKSKESKILPGLSTEKSSAYNCSGTILEQDKIGKLAVVAMFYQNGCYTDGKYNHKNYKVELGLVGDEGNEINLEAYKIYGPANKAVKFLASNHCVYYKFPTKENYIVYELEGDKINKIKEIPAGDIILNDYIPIKELIVSTIEGSKIIFFASASVKLNTYSKLSQTAEGAKIKKTTLFDIDKYRYQSNYKPSDIQNNYTNGRVYFPLTNNNERVYVIWQDQVDKTILLSSFGTDLKSETSLKLSNPAKANLIAATNDNLGNFYYCTQKTSDNVNSDDIITLYKINSKGQLLLQSNPETSKSGLDLYRYGNYMADLQYLDGKLGLFIARTMHKSSDGLNHQGGIAVVFDANSLKVIRNFGQTSGHSFDNYLTVNSENQFIGMDLGDNYPRGINLHKFTDSQIKSKIIYTFKTEHGMSAKSPAGATYPAYSEISTSTKKYYKWSNDNGTYTSLGVLIEVENGYVVLFTGEPDANGKSINNSKVGDANNDPRNIGFLKIVKNFENTKGSGTVVSDDMVLSKGITEQAGFYSFGGSWYDQRNSGVQWLTGLRDKAKGNIVNLKSAKLQDNSILLVWEQHSVSSYNSNYISTYAMKIDGNGKKISEPVEIGSHVRLNKRDDLLVVGSKVIMVSGSAVEKKLELIVFEMK